MAMRIDVKKMTLLDIPFVAELEKNTFSAPWSEATLMETLTHPGASFLCAFVDGVFAGYAGMLCILDEGQICNVAVVPAFRRMGVGSALMTAQLAAARERNLAVMMLEVRAGNLAAQALYEKEGWQKVGVRKNFYSSPREDGILYNLEL